MTARKQAKRNGGFSWRWLDAMEEFSRVDEDMTTGQRSAFRNLMTKRARCADPDGLNCWPSQETLAEYAGVSRVTVRWADGRALEAGLMVLTKHSGRGVSNRYRLVIPAELDGRGDDHSTGGKMVVGTTTQDQLDGRLDGRRDGRGDDHNLLPPSKSEEEEESASARLPCGRLAALQNPIPLAELFSANPPRVEDLGGAVTSTEEVGVPSPCPPGPQGQPEAFASSEAETIEKVCSAIATHAGTAIDQGRLGRALVDAQARTHWSDDVLAIYCVEKLKRMGNKVRIPSSFLVADLAQVDEGFMLSPRMKLADSWARLVSLADNAVDDFGMEADTRTEESLVRAELVDVYGFDRWLWTIKPANIDQAIRVISSAHYEAVERSRQRA
jgi:hypothetical protein